MVLGGDNIHSYHGHLIFLVFSLLKSFFVHNGTKRNSLLFVTRFMVSATLSFLDRSTGLTCSGYSSKLALDHRLLHNTQSCRTSRHTHIHTLSPLSPLSLSLLLGIAMRLKRRKRDEWIGTNNYGRPQEPQYDLDSFEDHPKPEKKKKDGSKEEEPSQSSK